MLRWTIGAAGVLMGLWGAWLLLPQLSFSLLIWFGGGVLVHDALIAPFVAGAGVLAVRRLAPAWRTPVAAGLVLSAVLLLLAVPLLARPAAAVVNPGLHDRDYPLGLILALLVVWAAVVVAGLARRASSAG